MRSIPFGAAAFLALFVVALAVAVRDTRPPPPPPHTVNNGIAIAYARGPFARDFSIEGTLSLERSPKNRSWYCDWLMLVAYREGKPEQPMVQAGLMRWARNDYNLSAFFALGRDDGRPIHYEDLAVLAEGRHHVALRGRTGLLHVLVDGRELRTIRLSTIFKPREHVYAQIAGEVYEPGDAIAGTLEHVVIAREGEAEARPYHDRCKRYDRGLRLEGPDDRLAVSGSFDTARPSGYLGCHNFFHPD